METIQNKNANFDINQLVTGLQKEDYRNENISRNFKIIMWVMAPLYLLISGMKLISDGPSLDQMGFLFFSMGFLVFGFLFRSLHQDYKSVDYGISTIEMLKKAAHRYKLWQTKTYLTIIPCSLIGIATSFGIQDIVPHPDLTIRLLVVFTAYFAVMSIAFFIGYLIWRYRQKPLRDKALELLAEFEK